MPLYKILTQWNLDLMKCQGTGENLFILSRVHYIEHQHLKNFQDKYQNVCYIEVKLIINLQNPPFPDLKNYCYNISVPSQYIATTLETQEQANNTA